MLATTDPLGRVTGYSYDARGNVLTITAPLSQTRTSTYDLVFNQVTSLTDPLGHVTTFAYAASGNLTTIIMGPVGKNSNFIGDAATHNKHRP